MRLHCWRYFMCSIHLHNFGTQYQIIQCKKRFEKMCNVYFHVRVIFLIFVYFICGCCSCFFFVFVLFYSFFVFVFNLMWCVFRIATHFMRKREQKNLSSSLCYISYISFIRAVSFLVSCKLVCTPLHCILCFERRAIWKVKRKNVKSFTHKLKRKRKNNI